MSSLTSKTIAIWGSTCLLRGLTYVLLPTPALTHFALPISAFPMSNEAGLRGVAIGVLYIIAGMQDNKPLAIATIPLRILTAIVFWLQSGDGTDVFAASNANNWKVASIWEGAGALVTGLAMVWDVYGERYRRVQRTGKKEE